MAKKPDTNWSSSSEGQWESHDPAPRVERAPEESSQPSKAELRTRRILGILLVVSALAILSNPGTVFFALISIPLGIALGARLLRNKGYSLRWDITWVLLGILMYAFISSPLSGLKGFILTADWRSEGIGIPAGWIVSILCVFIVNTMVLGSAAFLLATNLLSRRGVATRSVKGGTIFAAILLVILGALFGLPWLYRVDVGTPSMFGTFGAGAGIGPMGPNMTSVSFDSDNSVWVYRITLTNDVGKEVEVTGIAGKVASRTQQIAPPFDSNIEVIGGQRTAERIVVKPGETAVIRIHSKDPLWHVTLIENGDIRWQISFWR